MQPSVPETPLPRAQFFVLSCVLLAEPVVFTVIFPFMYYMVRDFGIAKEEKEIGYYVGLLAAVFSVAEMLSGLFWGVVSDRIGRRPVILIGMLGSFLGCMLLGLSKSYSFAIFSRCVSGLLNGNIGVVKTVIGELTDHTNQARGFSLISVMWGAGVIIGPSLSGLLSNPVEQFPYLFGSSILFKEYPYLLPCIVAASVTIPGFLIGFFVLEETLATKKVTQKADKNMPTENSPLLSERISPNTYVEHSTSSPFTFPVTMAILGYSMLGFQTTLFDELFAVWASTPIPFGGLSFTVSNIGLALSTGGISTIIGQLVVYPQCHRKLGTLSYYRWSMFAYLVTFFSFQLGSVVAKKIEYEGWNEGWVWAVVITNLTSKALCGAGAFTNIFILLNSNVPSEKLGTVNGVSQCVAAFTRAISPALGGFMWSWSLKAELPYPFNHQFMWILLTMCSCGSLIQSLWITEGKAKDEEIVAIEQTA